MNIDFERAGLVIFERGWLSSNNVLFGANGESESVLIDSGYASHAEQTVSLVRAALQGRGLDRIVNTHLHSDHCGGNHALQSAFGCRIDVPSGECRAVDTWNENELSFVATGQVCPRFTRTGCISSGSDMQLGGLLWQVIAAPGHDPQSVVLYQEESRLLISADALWHNGFGVVFPELGDSVGFEDVRRTLDLIAQLQVNWVIPGHGAPFQGIGDALTRAYRRLDRWISDPVGHARHAARVLIKFHMLEIRQTPVQSLLTWMRETPLLQAIHQRHFSEINMRSWQQTLLMELCNDGALSSRNNIVFDA